MNPSHTALYPVGPQSGHIFNLWWFLFWLALVAWAVTMTFAAFAVLRRRREPASAGALTRSVALAGGVTVLLLLAILIVSVSTGSLLSARSFPPSDAISIDVIGHQWWWEVQYEYSPASDQVTTANEIHVPVGKPVILKTTSNDVIHSFWIPNLYGKIDAIPNHSNLIWFRADKPGVYRGQCAEFCGLQHAHMGLLVIADPPAKFESWLAAQRASAATPTDDTLRAGQQVFLNGPCVLCHTIRGTTAAARVGPDLTHLASRMTIAAATLDNNRGNLGGWIADSQRIKPGNLMPPVNLPGTEMQPLLAYLESLK